VVVTTMKAGAEESVLLAWERGVATVKSGRVVKWKEAAR